MCPLYDTEAANLKRNLNPRLVGMKRWGQMAGEGTHAVKNALKKRST
jgi:hypothetical protein